MQETYALCHGRYRSFEELGRGSQGVVLRVVDHEAPERALVAKVYFGAVGDDASLRSEFRLLARLDSPGLVKVRDLAIDEATNRPFLVQDFVPGVAIDVAVLRTPEAKRSECLAELLGSTARALATLHDAGFIHGDLKPAHIRVTPERDVVLLDLGSAVAQASAALPSGTPGYLAPERTNGSRATIASDLYALGAVAFKAATGVLPQPGERGLRARAPWLSAPLAELVHSLVARAPENRPEDARDVLGRIGRTLPGAARRRYLATVGRDDELRALASAKYGSVTYVGGPSGIGKSHLLRELWVDALLGGRVTRLLAFPGVADAEVAGMIAFLKRDSSEPLAERDGRRALLLIDGLDEAPRELAAAIEAFRCRERAPSADVIVAGRNVPARAPRLDLGPLSPESALGLACSLSRRAELDVEEALRSSQGNPGWLAAALGGAPATMAMAAERLDGLSDEARSIVYAVAVANAELPEPVLNELVGFECGRISASLSQALERGLLARHVTRHGTSYVVAVRSLATELVKLLAPACANTLQPLAQALLAHEQAGAQQLLLVAEALPKEPLREAVLRRAAEQARQSALPSVEMAALSLLLASSESREVAHLLRLERLARDTGRQAEYPDLIEWLEQAVREAPQLGSLVLRRRAETAARRGDHSLAKDFVTRALAAARGSTVCEALVHATAGALLLYRAEWREAEAELSRADELLRACPPDEAPDTEELARLEHNRGVVALYAGRLEEAKHRFLGAIAQKRALGDLAGVRACLLNLGLTATKLGAYTDAEVALDEAIALARSLGQPLGEAWSLCARCELEVERKDVQRAEHWLALASELSNAAPLLVQRDLSLLRARVALLRSDAKEALGVVDQLEPELAAGDAAHQGRVLLIRAEAALLELPSAPRRSARLAARALRIARQAALSELEQGARNLLRRARPRREPNSSYPEPVKSEESEAEWYWLKELASSGDAASMLLALCRLAVARTNAERALVVMLDAEGAVVQAWGTDLDGFALSNAAARVTDELSAALFAHDSWFYQRELGRGSRVAARAPLSSGRHVALVLEHRFHNAQFDLLSSRELERWALLASLALRLDSNGRAEAVSAVASNQHDDVATRLPLRAARRSFPSIIGTSPALESALQRLDAAVDSTLPVLIRGETGTGKELFARALHEHGPRRSRPFVAVNCAAIADSLFEAELFGHTRGAFTGAERARAGLLAEAEGGTLLLDEIAELSLARQATLLRLLESGRYRSVGSDKELVSNARIVAATNRDLVQAVANGQFRSDLLFRINVLEIPIPPLRERSEDIALLADTFLRRENQKTELSDAALAALQSYEWPGNVRELSHVIERLLALGARRIELEDLPRTLRRNASVDLARLGSNAVSRTVSERDEVSAALSRCQGNISQAARALGLSRHGLKKKMLRLGLRSGEKSGD